MEFPFGFTNDMKLTNAMIAKNIEPDDIPKIFNMAQKLNKIGDQLDYHFAVRLKDGSRANITATTKIQAFEDGTKYVLTALKDDTEQVNVNRMLVQERASFREALLTNARFSFSFDVDDGYLREDIFTAAGEDILVPMGLKVPVSFDEFGKALIEYMGIEFERKELQNKVNCEGLKYLYAHGFTAETLNYYLSKVDRYSRTQCFLAEDVETGHLMATFISYDITKQVKEEMTQRNLLIESMAATDRANAAKTEFLSQMSHDIRTPMNAIIGFTHLASNNCSSRTRVLDYLGKIKASSNHLLALINDILDFSKIESGKLEIVNDEYEPAKAYLLQQAKEMNLL